MKNRVLCNWRTSLLGIILLVISVVMLYLKILSGSEFIALLPTIAGLLIAPDNILKKLNK